MANVEHSTLNALTESHEPKGAISATLGQVYVADGAASGAWQKVQGFGQYNDSRVTAGTPTQTMATGVRTQLICDGAGGTIEYPPSDATAPLWNVTTNKHEPIRAFDVYEIRLTFVANGYAGANPYLTLELDIGGSIGVIVSRTVYLSKGGADQLILLSFPVYTGTTYLANGGTLYCTYTGTGTVTTFSNNIYIGRTQRNT